MMFRKMITYFLPYEVILLIKFAQNTSQSIKRRYIGNYLFKQLSSSSLTSIKLEFGSGCRKGTSGWTTVDLAQGADIEWNLLNPVPLNQDSVDIIYSSHLLEHLSYKEIVKVLNDWFRILKPNGKLMVCVPDVSHYLKAYHNPDTIQKFISDFYQPAFNYHTPIDYLNYIAYMDGNHKHLFDKENLHAILESVGFVNIKERPFDPSLDSKGHDWESIYAEAAKP
jgi:predicted SAM-dependent methyltransferase